MSAYDTLQAKPAPEGIYLTFHDQPMVMIPWPVVPGAIAGLSRYFLNPPAASQEPDERRMLNDRDWIAVQPRLMAELTALHAAHQEGR